MAEGRRRGGLHAAAALLLALAATTGRAADEAGRFAIKGLGLIECARLQSVREDPAVAKALTAWVDGYVTARNRLVPDTFDVAGWESADLLTRMLDENCASLPDARLALVLEAILEKMMPARLAENSELVSATVDDKGLMIYRATLVRVQRTLAAQGRYVGAASGVFDDATRTALRAFQEDAGLPVSGLPDQVTLWRLFRPPQ